MHAPGGIRAHSPSRTAAADPHLRPSGHWDRVVLSDWEAYTSNLRLYTRNYEIFVVLFSITREIPKLPCV